MPNCNNRPISVDTSLPTNGSLPVPSAGLTTFDTECRELAEAMCKAVIRAMEQYRVSMIAKYAGSGDDPEVPTLLTAWKNKAMSGAGLPDCLDPEQVLTGVSDSMQPETANLTGQALLTGTFNNRTYDAVQTFGSQLTSFDIDDWHDE